MSRIALTGSGLYEYTADLEELSRWKEPKAPGVADTSEHATGAGGVGKTAWSTPRLQV